MAKSPGSAATTGEAATAVTVCALTSGSSMCCGIAPKSAPRSKSNEFHGMACRQRGRQIRGHRRNESNGRKGRGLQSRAAMLRRQRVNLIGVFFLRLRRGDSDAKADDLCFRGLRRRARPDRNDVRVRRRCGRRSSKQYIACRNIDLQIDAGGVHVDAAFDRPREPARRRYRRPAYQRIASLSPRERRGHR